MHNTQSSVSNTYQSNIYQLSLVFAPAGGTGMSMRHRSGQLNSLQRTRLHTSVLLRMLLSHRLSVTFSCQMDIYSPTHTRSLYLSHALSPFPQTCTLCRRLTVTPTSTATACSLCVVSHLLLLWKLKNLCCLGPAQTIRGRCSLWYFLGQVMLNTVLILLLISTGPLASKWEHFQTYRHFSDEHTWDLKRTLTHWKRPEYLNIWKRQQKQFKVCERACQAI